MLKQACVTRLTFLHTIQFGLVTNSFLYDHEYILYILKILTLIPGAIYISQEPLQGRPGAYCVYLFHGRDRSRRNSALRKFVG